MAVLSDLPEIVGFFSYSREDDTDSYGRLSALRGRIQAELRGLLGRTPKTFRLWQDKEAIASGTLWESEIKNAVSQALFFVPIITPTVVASRYCRFELEAFLEREALLLRDDLIFPILYIDVPALDEGGLSHDDPILSLIAKRQYVDWREFRYLDVDSTEVRREVGRFCMDIRNALRRRWASPEEIKQQEEAAAQQKEQAERGQQEAAARQREQARRERQEAAARQREQAKRERQEAAARQKEQAEGAEQEAAKRRAEEETRQRTIEQQGRREKEPERTPIPPAEGEQPRAAEAAAQQPGFVAGERPALKGLAATDQKKWRMAAIVGSVAAVILLTAVAVWLNRPANPPLAANNTVPALVGPGNAPLPSGLNAQMFPFMVCNRTAQTASVAVAAHASVTDTRWQAQGWWMVSPGQCSAIGSFPQGWFYYYAKSDSRDWPGTDKDKSNTCVRTANFKREDPEGYKCAGDEKLVPFNGKHIESDDTFTWTLKAASNNESESNNAPVDKNAPADGLTQREIDACVNRDQKFSADEQISGCTESIRSQRWSGKDLAWAYGNRCIALKDKALYDRAMGDCNQAIKLDEKDAHAFNTRGAIYHLTEKYDEAIAEYTKAIRIDPKFIDPLHNRGMSHAAKGDYESAIDDYNAALKIDPRDALALYERGMAKQRAGDDRGGKADIAAAKKIDPNIGN